MKIIHIVGNRPQFIKLAPFLNAAKKYKKIQNIILHSGQHYDFLMSKLFFLELGIPNPHYNLGAGSGSHGVQTGKILAKLDSVLLKERPDIAVVYGDTNTTLAGAIAAYKLHIPLAHVESGMREFIWRPEEMNKKIADHCSDFCFCPLKRAAKNLENEGISKKHIFWTGDITFDAFLQNKSKALKKGKIIVPEEPYILMTLHRAETVDIKSRIRGIVEAVMESPLRVIYPVHPRTKLQLKRFGLYDKLEKCKHIELLDPLGYFEFIKLLLYSELVITDSGGVLKDAFFAGKPGVVLDDTTEYKEIFDAGFNVLAGTDKKKILRKIKAMLGKKLDFTNRPEKIFGSGSSAEKMLSIITKSLGGNV